MVAIGNGANVGGGTELTPDADPEDGRLDVMISRAVSPRAKLGYVAQLRKGEHQERDDVVYLRGSHGLGHRRGVLGPPPTGRSTAGAQPHVAHRAAAYTMVLPPLVGLGPQQVARASRGGPASTPAWNRESTPSSIIIAAMRRRTVRRLTPRVRAICSSWRRAPAAAAGSARRSGLASPCRAGHGAARAHSASNTGSPPRPASAAARQPGLVGQAERVRAGRRARPR